MRKQIGAVLLVVLSWTAVSPAGGDEALPQLIARADAAKLDQQPDLYVEVAERELKALNDSYKAEHWDEFSSRLQDLVKYSDKAHASAIHSKKRVKRTEIKIRQFSGRLRDIKLNIDMEVQPQVQAAIDRLETFRTELLESMFGSKEHE